VNGKRRESGTKGQGSGFGGIVFLFIEDNTVNTQHFTSNDNNKKIKKLKVS